jgi:hypothetical protein
MKTQKIIALLAMGLLLASCGEEVMVDETPVVDAVIEETATGEVMVEDEAMTEEVMAEETATGEVMVEDEAMTEEVITDESMNETPSVVTEESM